MQAIMIADATQGGISYDRALEMTATERRAAIEVIKEIRDKQKKEMEKANAPKK